MMLKDLVFDQSLRRGFFVSRKSPDSQVRETLSMLQPVTTTLELVRIGGSGDGGYLVPDDLADLDACFSPGVDVTASFESDMLARGVPCFLADASVDGPPISDSRIDFEAKFLGVVNDPKFTTLDAWVKRKWPQGSDSLILQMDIEGHEWPVLLNASDDVLNSFRIIVLELHGLPHLFDSAALSLIRACLDRLTRIFHVVHVHPNNFMPNFRYRDWEIPHFLEVTLLRKDRAEVTGVVSQLPHHLDEPNVAGVADVALPAFLRGTKAGIAG